MTVAPNQLAVARDRLNPRDRIQAALAALGADELEVLALVADGLVGGRGIYGELELSADRRDMVGEGLEEARDAAIYLTAALVRLRRVASHAKPAQERRSPSPAGAETGRRHGQLSAPHEVSAARPAPAPAPGRPRAAPSTSPIARPVASRSPARTR